MRTGILLPTFEPKAEHALEVARRAEEAGVDGVFCYDHIWPMGQPQRPAIAPFPVLARVATSTMAISVGTLVARVGLVPDGVLVSQFETLQALAPGRVVAGLGTGDRLSAKENAAYGLEHESSTVRRARLRTCARTLRARAVPVWIGDGAPATRALAHEEGVALNLWSSPPEVVAELSPYGEVTWGGTVEGPLKAAVCRLGEAGASWVVVPWSVDLHELARAAR